MFFRLVFILAFAILSGIPASIQTVMAADNIDYLFDESALGQHAEQKLLEPVQKPQDALPPEVEEQKPQASPPALPDLSRVMGGGEFKDIHEAPSLSAYILSAGDELQITVYNEPSLSGKHRIDSDDLISLPLIGDIEVTGMSAADLQRRIESDLAQGYLVRPSVSIQVLTYRPFYILGEVRNPGSYDYVSGITVLKAVALAGGFTYRAEEDEVKILRKQGGCSDKYKEYPVQAKVMPGDIILVEESFF